MEKQTVLPAQDANVVPVVDDANVSTPIEDPTEVGGLDEPVRVNGSPPTPAEVIERTRELFSNPLMQEPNVHPDLKPLFDAVVWVSSRSTWIEFLYNELLELKKSGLPKADELPGSPELARRRLHYAERKTVWLAEYAARGETVIIPDFVEPLWTTRIREWSECYRDWCASISDAIKEAQSPAVAAIMDAGELRPAHKWTAQTIKGLRELASLLHPVNNGGGDGMGFMRAGLPPLPENFLTCVREACKCRTDLAAVSPHVNRDGHAGGSVDGKSERVNGEPPASSDVKPGTMAGDGKTAKQSTDGWPALVRVYVNDVSDDKFQQILAIAEREDLSLNEKLEQMHQVFPIPSSVKSKKFADLFRVSEQAVRQTPFWKSRHKGKGQRIEAYRKKSDLVSRNDRQVKEDFGTEISEEDELSEKDQV